NATVRTQLADADRTSYAVGIRLNVPIFTGLSSFSDRAALAAAESRADAERQRLLNDLSVEAVKAAEDLKAGLEIVEASDEALKMNQAALREAQGLYSTGTATYLQLSDAQRNALDSELSADQSKVDYILRVARYFITRGWSLDSLVQALNKGIK
ncbi:MAG TPA: TolC family protein, partial [Bdellovibrionales bacterium]|nr:TolC family protein [Bdellovibrionales bacterium]